MGRGAIGFERLVEVHDGRKLLVLDVDQVGRIRGLVLGLRQHHRDRLALIDDLFIGNREPRRALLLFRHEGRCDRHRPGEHLGEILVGVDGNHSWRLGGLGDVDALNDGVGEGAADNGKEDAA